MTDPIRVFFALWPPRPVAEDLAAIAEALQPVTLGRASRIESLHLTLAFLGEIPRASLPAALEAASGLEAGPFSLTLDRIGFFERPAIVWAGCMQPPGGLVSLACSLQSRLSDAGFIRERRTFVPHVTLLRGAEHPPPGLEPGLPEWQVGRFVLVASVAAAGGRRYEILEDWPLGGL